MLLEPTVPVPGQEIRMQDFVADLLRHEDALVEPIEPEGLECCHTPCSDHGS